MRKTFGILLVLCLLLTACGSGGEKQYTVTYLTLFDTVTTITGWAKSEAEFQETCEEIYQQLEYYHRLFDIYYEYQGLNNLKTVNDRAGICPVEVDSVLIEFLQDCKEYYTLTGGKVNVAMGSVLKLWHDAREAALEDPDSAQVPDSQSLTAAGAYTDIDAIILNPETSTVYISHSAVQLDVGAVAKGWAAQKVAQQAPSGLLISVGGNVCATGPKQAPDTPWIIGVQDPDGEDYLAKLSITGGSVVTSGDYQRYFTVDGITYHHIIDPDTWMPATLWRSVTVVCADSALADVLSTALFLLPLEQGQALLTQVNAQAMWLSADGQIYYSDGFQTWLSA